MKFLVLENNIYGTVHTRYYLAKVMKKKCSFVLDGHSLSPNIHIETYEKKHSLGEEII